MAANKKLTKLFTEIADAIREVGEKNKPIRVAEFADEIRNLPLPSTPVEEKDYNFYDYDGTLLHSYTYDEAMALDDMPELPYHKGLICEGWNYSLEQMRQQGTRKCDIGAFYVTDDGATRLYMNIPYGNKEVSLLFYFLSPNICSVDWGDGSERDLAKTNVVLNHTYSNRGAYVISIHVTENYHVDLGYNDLSVFNTNNSNNSGIPMNAALCYKVEMGRNMGLTTRAFRGCISLKTISMSKYTNPMATAAFQNCHIDCVVTPPTNVVNIFSNDNVRRVIWSVGTTNYNTAVGASKIVIPYGVTTIVNIEGFTGEIYFPETVETMRGRGGFDCMYDFSALKRVPVLSYSLLHNASLSKLIIIVPDMLYDEWINATNWSALLNYIVKDSEFKR